MKCQNQLSHLENAIDRAFPTGRINRYHLAKKWDEIHTAALEEHFNCEGDH